MIKELVPFCQPGNIHDDFDSPHQSSIFIFTHFFLFVSSSQLVSVERLCVTTARALNEKMDFDGAANVERIHQVRVLSNPRNVLHF